MQLQFLKHSQIDKRRWLHAIQQSSNGLIYAWPQYLDAVSPSWQALVNEDYSLVMPLTYRRKWGVRYLYQPAFCQQLGIFGNAVNPGIVEKFLHAAAQHFSFAEIQLNFQSSLLSENKLIRKNYVLSLSETYQTIRNSYGKDLIKKNLQRTEKFNLQYQASNNYVAAIDAFEELYSRRMTGNTEADYNALKEIYKQLQKKENAFVREVLLPNGELLACGVFFKDDKRIYNIASSTFPNGRTLEANHFLFDQLIQEFAGSDLLLDFEGSEITGVERFYKKFGTQNQPYFPCRWNNLPWPIRFLKK